MRDDPEGHYGALGLSPDATGEAVAAAFRAAARRLHPDVPETGDAAAFIRVRQAYEILSDPARRAAYDRAAGAPAEDAESWYPGRAAHAQSAEVDLSETLSEAWLHRAPGWSVWLWGGAAALAVVAVLISVADLRHARPFANAPNLPLPPPAPEPKLAPPRGPSPLSGITAAYVQPAGEPAVLWHREGGGERFSPAGRLQAFTPVTIHRIEPGYGMAEVTTGDGTEGYVYSVRLTPGNAADAQRARCIFDAGAPPENNEVLARRGDGPARVRIENRRDQPAVVKLRDMHGVAIASVFVAPLGTATLDHLPAGAYRPDYAFGELWSHGCRRFMAGMRAERFARFDPLDGASRRYIIPADEPVALSDEAFNQD